ncbi:hypothetical protein ES703_23084 [subsurface metagenome]
MIRQYVTVVLDGTEFSAEIKDGEVVGWQPLTLKELNSDIDSCISYLGDIKEAIRQTNVNPIP